MTTDRPLMLIVDDDPIVHQLISSILVPAGYDVSSARRGDEAIRMASDLNPDLILLDVMMPEMDGFEVINRLKTDKSTSDIPVIFLSAKVDPSDKVRALQLGATDFIGKPFDRAELLARIRAHTKIRSQEKALQECIYKAFGIKLTLAETKQVCAVDDAMLHAEFDCLMDEKIFTGKPDIKSEVDLSEKDFGTVKRTFVEMYEKLKEQNPG